MWLPLTKFMVKRAFPCASNVLEWSNNSSEDPKYNEEFKGAYAK